MPRTAMARLAGCASVAVLVLLCACGGGTKGGPTNPATPESVSAKVGASGGGLATGYLGAMEAMKNSSALGSMMNGLAPLQTALGGLGGSLSLPRLPSFPPEELSRYLSTRVFTQAHVESRDATSVTYLLKGEDVCPYHLPDGTSTLGPAAGATLGASCAAAVDQIQLRVRATEPSASEVDFTFLLGPDQASPLTVRLTPDTADFVVDLGGARGVLLEALLGSAASSIHLAMSGVVDLKIHVNRQAGGKQDVTFSSSITRPLDVSLEASGSTITFTSEVKEPWVSLRVDGVDKQVALALDLGVTTVGLPYVDSMGQATTKRTQLTLGGLSLGAALHEGQPESYTLTGLGLGSVQSKVTVGGETLGALDLSPRKVAVTFAGDPGAADRTIFGIGSGTKATVFVDTRVVGGVDPSFAGKTYTLEVSAGTGDPKLEPYEVAGVMTMKMVAGSFTLSDGTRSLTVAQGQCLLRNPPAVTTSWVDDYRAGACP